MICSKCNTVNNLGSKFCISCGNTLIVENTVGVQVAEQSQVINESLVQPVQQTINNQQITNFQSLAVSDKPLNYLMFIIAILLKPFKSFKEEESKLSNAKTSLIFGSIVAGSMMLINLIKAMFSAIFVKTIDYSTFQYKTTLDFSNLKNLDYVSLIAKNFLIYAGIIVAIALIYYLVGLAFKKSVNFIKMLSISATSLLPYIILGMIVSPIFGKIWLPLSIVAMVGGVVYSILIFLNLINADIQFDTTDLKIYFNLICLSILGVAGYYLFINLLTSNIGGQINDLLNMFG